MIAFTASWCCTIASKEISWAASVKPKMKPASWFGMNPMGMMVKR